MDCYVRELIYGHAREGGSGDRKMKEVLPHQSRCLQRHQYRLILIPSTVSCVLGSGPDTKHQAQHSSPLTKPFIFSTPYYVVDKQNPIRTVHSEATFIEVLVGIRLDFSFNSLIFLLLHSEKC